MEEMQDSQTMKISGSMAIPVDASGDKALTGGLDCQAGQTATAFRFFFESRYHRKKIGEVQRVYNLLKWAPLLLNLPPR
jgi:hypothetical protein